MKKIYYSVIIVLLSIVVVRPVYADININVSGNGEGSSNTVSVSSDSNTTSESTNNSQTTNDVTSTADTGNNEANNNTDGDVSISTGDADTTTTVTNEVNTANINAGPCCGEVSATISNNGSDSQNSINLSSTTDISITLNQNANVTNNITTNANTGGNSANNNGGSVGITTGSIRGSTTVINGVNIADIDVRTGGFSNLYLTIFGNGSNSTNDIAVVLQSDVVINKLETAFVTNFITNDLNTGGNSANGNLGAVLIGTGDITYMTSVVNDPINSNNISIIDCDCCPPVVPPPPPPPPPGPPGPNDNGGNGGPPDPSSNNNNDPGTGGSVLGAMAGKILPATGNILNHGMIWLLSLMLLLSGLLLKLRRGRKALAIT